MNTDGPSHLRSLVSKLCYSAVGMAALLAAIVGGMTWSKMRQTAALKQQIQHAVSLPPNDANHPHVAPFAPTGLVVSAGVTFRCNGGVVRAKGLYALRQDPEAPAVLAVPIQRRGSRIHLLQAAENCMAAKPGVPYGRIRFHYAHGETRHFDLIHKVHGRDWWVDPRKAGANDPMPDPNTTIGWEKMTPDGFVIRLYHTRLENPLPNETIVSADFLPGLHEPSLMVFGLTVDDDARPLAAPWFAEAGAPVLGNIVYDLQDEAGNKIPGAQLKWDLMWRGVRVDYSPLMADERGRVQVDFIAGTGTRIRYTASAPGGYSATATELAEDPVGLTRTIKLSKVNGP